jgi:hypothetical protein
VVKIREPRQEVRRIARTKPFASYGVACLRTPKNAPEASVVRSALSKSPRNFKLTISLLLEEIHETVRGIPTRLAWACLPVVSCEKQEVMKFGLNVAGQVLVAVTPGTTIANVGCSSQVIA